MCSHFLLINDVIINFSFDPAKVYLFYDLYKKKLTFYYKGKGRMGAVEAVGAVGGVGAVVAFDVK